MIVAAYTQSPAKAPQNIRVEPVVVCDVRQYREIAIRGREVASAGRCPVSAEYNLPGLLAALGDGTVDKVLESRKGCERIGHAISQRGE